MQNQIFAPVIAEVTSDSLPPGRSRFAVFLDGDTNNTSDDNIVDEGYFDNCYSYDLFLEDIVFRDSLLEQRDALQVEVKKSRAIIDRLQSDLSNNCVCSNKPPAGSSNELP